MKALILAAGKGKRLRPITEDIPKAMVEIGGKPILERIILQLRPFIKDFVIVVGYQKEKVTNYFGKGEKLGVNITYTEQKELLGTGHAILQAEQGLQGEKNFLMIFADTYFDEKQLKEILEKEADGVIAVTTVFDPSNYGIVELDNNSRVVNVLEKPSSPPTNLAVLGIYRLPAEIFTELKKIKPSERGEYELVDAVRPLLVKQLWKAVMIQAKDVGTLEELENARKEEQKLGV